MEKPLVFGFTPYQGRTSSVPTAPLEKYTRPIGAEVEEQMRKLQAIFETHEASFTVPPSIMMKLFGHDVSREIVPFLLTMPEQVITWAKVPPPPPLVVQKERIFIVIVPVHTIVESSCYAQFGAHWCPGDTHRPKEPNLQTSRTLLGTLTSLYVEERMPLMFTIIKCPRIPFLVSLTYILQQYMILV